MFEVSSEIFDYDNLNAQAKLVYIYLASCEKEGINPSHEIISQSCSIGSATVIRALKELVENGLIAAEKHGAGVRNTYSIVNKEALVV